MVTNRKSKVADRSVMVPVTLSDLERWGTRGPNFLADLHNHALVVSPRMTEFGIVTQVGRNISACPKFVGPYLRPNSLT